MPPPYLPVVYIVNNEHILFTFFDSGFTKHTCVKKLLNIFKNRLTLSIYFFSKAKEAELMQ